MCISQLITYRTTCGLIEHKSSDKINGYIGIVRSGKYREVDLLSASLNNGDSKRTKFPTSAIATLRMKLPSSSSLTLNESSKSLLSFGSIVTKFSLVKSCLLLGCTGSQSIFNSSACFWAGEENSGSNPAS